MAFHLIAHRGLPYRFPENSLVGFAAAIQAGATWIETDVQLTNDEVPILFHDAEMTRLCGLRGDVTDATIGQLQRLGVSQPDRFGALFRGNPVTTLRQLLYLLTQHPTVRLFLELKSESKWKFGTECFVDRVLTVLSDCELTDRVVAISFADSILRTVRRRSNLPIGWVAASWTDDMKSFLADLAPAYFFIEQKLLEKASPPPLAESPWRGPWQTVLYTVNEPTIARSFLGSGYDWQETDHYDEMSMIFKDSTAE